MRIPGLPQEYAHAVQVIKNAILDSQRKTARMANGEQLSLYFGIGRFVSINSREGTWGTNAISKSPESSAVRWRLLLCQKSIDLCFEFGQVIDDDHPDHVIRHGRIIVYHSVPSSNYGPCIGNLNLRIVLQYLIDSLSNDTEDAP